MDGVVSILSGRHFISALQFDAACKAQGGVRYIIYFTIAVVVVHTTLSFLTIRKHKLLPHASTSPLLKRLVKEAVWTWVLVCGIIAARLPYTMRALSFSIDLTIVWPMTILDIVICRMILSMR
ncbi:hypothetical protein BDQ17DRAFT_149527 [Cyathus striatus]|nr:hypothetical protein BDQ17DRAFT_149527 [Cyathus striatus]